MFRQDNSAAGLRNGDNVRIRRRWNSPYAGRTGVLSAIEPNDPYGACLVHFEDGTQFRYGFKELESVAARRVNGLLRLNT